MYWISPFHSELGISHQGNRMSVQEARTRSSETHAGSLTPIASSLLPRITAGRGILERSWEPGPPQHSQLFSVPAGWRKFAGKSAQKRRKTPAYRAIAHPKTSLSGTFS
jgi:hypothetical protein